MRFPDGARMSPAERRGFDLACDTLQAWGAQIASAGRNLATRTASVQAVPLDRLMQHTGQTVADLARAAQIVADRDTQTDADPRQLT